jgi:CheY-like chemotaxis protein/anti-sigma regulatory factor (Ser/Thr protein kinase)
MTPDETRVLIVDDNPIDRELLDAYLSREGYMLETAEDGIQAFQILETDPWRFDVVLLDRSMPRLGGMQLLQWMKANSELRALPVILQTASDSRGDLIEAMRAGAFYYLTKPYDVDVLLSVVSTAAHDRAAHKQLQSIARRATTATRLLRNARFSLRTIEEARDVGTLIAGLCPDPVNTVIGLTELIVNAIEHGNLGITYDEKSALNASGRWEEEMQIRLESSENATKRVDVEFERDDEEIRITIRDQGHGFDFNKYLNPEPSRMFDTHGRGIVIARRLSFEELEYHGCGNEVVGRISVAADDG